jgi:hypothetical protein
MTASPPPPPRLQAFANSQATAADLADQLAAQRGVVDATSAQLADAQHSVKVLAAEVQALGQARSRAAGDGGRAAAQVAELQEQLAAAREAAREAQLGATQRAVGAQRDLALSRDKVGVGWGAGFGEGWGCGVWTAGTAVCTTRW